LNAVYSVLNLINYLQYKVPKVVLGKLFEMFGPRLQVTYSIMCSHIGRVGTGVFLNHTCKINGHFGEITTELIEKRTICDVYGTYWSANRRRSSKVMH
jgi:hypothetical protein